MSTGNRKDMILFRKLIAAATAIAVLLTSVDLSLAQEVFAAKRAELAYKLSPPLRTKPPFDKTFKSDFAFLYLAGVFGSSLYKIHDLRLSEYGAGECLEKIQKEIENIKAKIREKSKDEGIDLAQYEYERIYEKDSSVYIPYKYKRGDEVREMLLKYFIPNGKENFHFTPIPLDNEGKKVIGMCRGDVAPPKIEAGQAPSAPSHAAGGEMEASQLTSSLEALKKELGIPLKLEPGVPTSGTVLLRYHNRFDNGVLGGNEKVFNIAREIGLDTRPVEAGLMDFGFAGHDMAVRRIANPHNEDKIAVYGCAGADWSNAILSTNANRVYLVDRTPMDIGTLRRILSEEWDKSEQYQKILLTEYVIHKRNNGYAPSLDTLKDIERLLLIELKCMGVKKFNDDGSENIKIIENTDGTITINFEWAYVGQEPREYSIAYIQADIENPAAYPESLRKVLGQGIDIYYQRASLSAPERYAEYLPSIASSIKGDGCLITDDASNKTININPDALLENMNLSFTAKGEVVSDEMRQWEGFIEVHLGALPLLGSVPYGYGWRVNIRQKKHRTGVRPHLVNDFSKRGQTPSAIRDDWVNVIVRLVGDGYKVVLNKGDPARERDAKNTRYILDAVGSKVRRSRNFVVKAFSNKDKAVSFLAGNDKSGGVEAVITIDTGIFHIARLLKIPTVVVTTENSGGFIPEAKDRFREVTIGKFYPESVVRELRALEISSFASASPSAAQPARPTAALPPSFRGSVTEGPDGKTHWGREKPKAGQPSKADKVSTSIKAQQAKSANLPEAGSARSISAGHIFKTIGVTRSAQKFADMVDAVGIGGRDNVICIGAGIRGVEPIVCALKGAKVDVIQPRVYKGLQQTGILTHYIAMERERIAKYVGEDLIGNRIDTDSYRGKAENVKLPTNHYSCGFLLGVLDDPLTTNRRRLINALLSSLRDKATVFISVLDYKLRNDYVAFFRECADTLGYETIIAQTFAVGGREIIYQLRVIRKPMKKITPEPRKGTGSERKPASEPAAETPSGKKLHMHHRTPPEDIGSNETPAGMSDWDRVAQGMAKEIEEQRKSQSGARKTPPPAKPRETSETSPESSLGGFDGTIHTLPPDGVTASPEVTEYDGDIRRNLNRAMAEMRRTGRLSSIEEMVVRLRYGVFDSDEFPEEFRNKIEDMMRNKEARVANEPYCFSLDEVGELLPTSYTGQKRKRSEEGVRGIEKQAFKKLRQHPLCQELFGEYLPQPSHLRSGKARRVPEAKAEIAPEREARPAAEPAAVEPNEEVKWGAKAADTMKNCGDKIEKVEKQDIMAAIEVNGWLPDEKRAEIQSFASALKHLTDKLRNKGVLGNVRIVYGDSETLAANIIAERDRYGIKNKNIVVLGSEDTLRKKLSALNNEAFLACLDPKTFEGANYIPLFEMLDIAMNLAFEMKTLEDVRAEHANMDKIDPIGERIIRIIPNAGVLKTEGHDIQHRQMEEFERQA